MSRPEDNIAQVVEACVIDTTTVSNETTKKTTVAATIMTTITTGTLSLEREETNTEIASKEIIKTYDEIAREVWEGKWGNGPERRQRIEKAGYDYSKVQEKVVELTEECAPLIEDNPEDSSIEDENKNYVGDFQGTWYHTEGCSSPGGSGRTLINCNTEEEIKGSIASRTLYDKYGYMNNERTKVYLTFDDAYSCDKYGNRFCFMGDICSCMNGYYYLDDCCRDFWVIDFYYLSEYNNCPFKDAGRICNIKCWIVN